MEGSDVVGAIGGTVGVIGGTAEIASGMGIGGVGVGGIVSVGSSPCSIGIGVDCVCSVCGGSRGAIMGWTPGGAN